MVIISRYEEDVSWLENYNFDYIIYNKGSELSSDYNVSNIDNIGNNQRDIFKYIIENYDNLPDVMTFIQGDPFEHCKKEKFDKLINNTTFTALESYEDIQQNDAQILDESGGYMEINNSWYINAHNGTYNQSCAYSSFFEFMLKTFKNYTYEPWVRFSPGSQYIITKEIAKFYSKKFWEFLMNILYKNNMTEGHIIERSLWMIFNCYLEPIDELK
jgi:hypothetical protein